MAASNLFGITSGSTVLSSTLRLRPEGSGPPPKGSEERWNLAESAGRLVEISGSGAAASLTFAFGLVLEAQQQGELVGWVTVTESFFYPPDVAQGGVDLDALVVARVPDLRAVSRAGEKLLRSGAFGLVVLDVGAAEIPMPLQARLAGLARQHHAALVCLTEKEKRDFSLGSLVSLRVHAERTQLPQGRFTCKLKVLKDKRRGPTWSQAEVYRGPAGLC
ncbi:MAG: recombinase A [Deltaproteobacteria bacterium]|nr:recombinase A [Deltaproteobacteria bacterium]